MRESVTSLAQPGNGATRRPPRSDLELVDAFIAASRGLVAVAARSLAGMGEDITLPQYRALVVLASRGPQRAADLAASLDVTPSTASRMIERLVRKHLVGRARTKEDRRTLRVYLTKSGRRIVAAVTDRRRAEITRILGEMPDDGRVPLTAALRAFAAAAGEVPEQDWALGWDEADVALDLEGDEEDDEDGEAAGGDGPDAATPHTGNGPEAATPHTGNGPEAATPNVGNGPEAATPHTGNGPDAATPHAGDTGDVTGPDRSGDGSASGA